MGKMIRTAVRLFFVVTFLTGIAYPLAVSGLAQALFTRQANGSLIPIGGGKAVSLLIGQPFSDPRYFWGRPSATTPVAYNGVASAGSNLGPTNPVLAEAVRKRIANLRSAGQESRLPVPVDLVTASGSGLDPHVSPAAALYQVARVAKARGLEAGKVAGLVQMQIQERPFGIFGEPVVNVLRLNIALDGLR